MLYGQCTIQGRRKHFKTSLAIFFSWHDSKLNYRRCCIFNLITPCQSYSFLYNYVCLYISVSRKYLEGQRGNYFQQIDVSTDADSPPGTNIDTARGEANMPA